MQDERAVQKGREHNGQQRKQQLKAEKSPQGVGRSKVMNQGRDRPTSTREPSETRFVLVSPHFASRPPHHLFISKRCKQE